MDNLKLTPKRKEILNLLSIDNPFMLLRYYPYRYEHFILQPLTFELHENKVTIQGIVEDVKVDLYGHKKCKVILLIRYLEELVKVILFNRYGWSKVLKKGMHLVVHGKYNAFKHEIVASTFFVGYLEEKEKYIPIYSLPNDVKTQTFQNFVKSLFDYYNRNNQIINQIPEFFVEKYRLISLSESLQAIHFPKSHQELHQAKRHLKYEEFLNFCTMAACKRKLLVSSSQKIEKHYNHDFLNQVIDSLPFQLSEDQQEVLNEILKDLNSNICMNRLLQGDVGSGKTIIALLTLVANYSVDYQGALMVPTDILARQHYEEFKKVLVNYHLPIYLLVSDMPSKEKQMVIERLNTNLPGIVIGTHALLQENIIFKNLGLVVIDEQHRFGVKQRLALKEKGTNIDILYMSATPIPRTLASTYYLDMDVSTIAHYPNLERKVISEFKSSNDLSKLKPEVFNYFKQDLNGKVYVICPSIENSRLEMQNVLDIYQQLQALFPEYQSQFLHGKLKNEEKNAIMNDFCYGNTKILVSTTVIEVGINVREANMMIILNAERFGLAQIHQLRGRIGRYGKPGICYLCSDSKDEDALERLQFLAANSDGFKISEYDLKRRGPGEMLGLKQSGLPSFSIANLVDDYNILKTASKDAKYILNHPELFKNYLYKINQSLHEEEKYLD